jgi:hypothetical protein
VNVIFSEPVDFTGPEGGGERMATAPGEKNNTALLPSVVEKAIVSPETTRIESALGTRTPPLLVRVISVCAIAVTLVHFAHDVHYFFFLAFASALAFANAA